MFNFIEDALRIGLAAVSFEKMQPSSEDLTSLRVLVRKPYVWKRYMLWIYQSERGPPEHTPSEARAFKSVYVAMKSYYEPLG